MRNRPSKKKKLSSSRKGVKKKHGNSGNQLASISNKEYHLPSSDFSNTMDVSPPSQSSRPDMPQSDLMSKFEQRLKSGQFRFLNQSLYSLTGSESRSLFEKNKTLFHEYHQGYIQSMKHWPVQPVDIAIRWLRKKPKSLSVVDYGCGEARLLKSNLHHSVTSLDLVKLDEGVTECDMTNSPLPDQSQDIAIFSLSLMGTDYHKCLVDASRTLKIDGILWIAEVCSRFRNEDFHPFAAAVELLGFKQMSTNKPSKYFVVFIFKKVSLRESNVRIAWPSLKPCLYKKR